MTRRVDVWWALALTAVGAVALFGQDTDWKGQWPWTLDMIAGSSVLSAPVAAACAAHLMLGRAPLAPVIRSTPRGAWVPAACAARAWLIAVVATAVTSVVACGATLTVPRGGPVQWWAALAGLPVLAVGALAGAAIGRWWPSPLAVIVIGPVFFAATGFAPSPITDILRPGPYSGSWAGLAFDAATVTALAAAGTALAAAILAAIWWGERRGRPGRPGVGLGLIAAVTLAAAGGWVHATGVERSRVSAERPTACAGTSPTVCVAPTERRALRSTASMMAAAGRELDAIGITLPSRYESLLPGYLPPPEVGMLTWLDARGELTATAAAENIAHPAACPAWVDPVRPPPDRGYDGMRLVANWILTRQGEPADPWSASEAAWLRTADSESALRAVRSTFAALRQCELKAIRLPWRQHGR